MLFLIHKLFIVLQSDDEAIRTSWRDIFSGWKPIDNVQKKISANIILRLSLEGSLPDLPDSRPLFFDRRPWPMGGLSVFPENNKKVKLRFPDGAQVMSLIKP